MDNRIRPGRRCGAAAFGTFVAVSATALALFGGTGTANAAGFALKEQSAAALGNAFAGATAGAEDVTYMFFNPAGLVRHEGNQAAAVLSYIIPTAETTGATGGLGGSDTQDGGVSALVPALYGMWSVSSDLKLAVGINVPFGLSTEYDLDWVGGFSAIESSVATININPAIAYRVNESFSVGFGLQAQMADVVLSSQLPVAGSPLFEVTGDDWGFGFNLGAMYELSPQTRVGAAYRSQIKSEVSGTGEIVGVVSTGANADLTTPDSASVGVYHELSDSIAIMGEVAWTGWSTFDQIQINLDANLGFGTTVIIPEDWKDVWFYSLGATWQPNDDWTLRGGVAYDESPIPDTTRSPRLPGNNRTWLAVGAKYAPAPNLDIDFGYTHIFVEDATVNLAAVTATFEGHIDIITAQATYRF